MHRLLDKLLLRSNWRRDILHQFEHRFGYFPLLEHGGRTYARARLSAFRSDVEWLITFEIFGFSFKGGFCDTIIYGFGNKLRHRDLHFGKAIAILNERGQEVVEHDPPWELDPTNFFVKADDKLHHFTPTHADYKALSLDLPLDRRAEVDDDADLRLLTQILRYVAYHSPSIIFFQTNELLSELGRPETLPLFLQTFEWQHPYANKDETLGNNICMQSLATALAENDSSLLHCTESSSNTHWSNWDPWPPY